jgi:zinc transport system permease protein
MEVMYLFQFGFVRNAVAAGVCIALLAAILGLFLVLRRISLIGDGLAHVSFGGVALGMALGIAPTYAALPVAVGGAFLILKLMDKARVYGDAAIGIVSAAAVAAGVILASKGGGFGIDLMGYLFGNILSVGRGELALAVCMSVAVILLIARYAKDLFALSFDETYARTLGVNVGRVDAVFFAVTAVAVVLAIRLVGVLLVSAMLILPAATALQFAKSFRSAMIASSMYAVAGVLAGVIISFILDIPTGAAIVLTSFAVFLLAAAARRVLRSGV